MLTLVLGVAVGIAVCRRTVPMLPTLIGSVVACVPMNDPGIPVKIVV